MDYGGDPGLQDVDAQWVVGGPDSGGVRSFVLWHEHLFLVEQDFTGCSIGTGTPVAAFLAEFRDATDARYREVVADLVQRGSAPPEG